MSSRVLQFLARKNILKMVIDFGELCLDCIILRFCYITCNRLCSTPFASPKRRNCAALQRNASRSIWLPPEHRNAVNKGSAGIVCVDCNLVLDVVWRVNKLNNSGLEFREHF
jgi:hypothetical protein